MWWQEYLGWGGLKQLFAWQAGCARRWRRRWWTPARPLAGPPTGSSSHHWSNIWNWGSHGKIIMTQLNVGLNEYSKLACWWVFNSLLKRPELLVGKYIVLFNLKSASKQCQEVDNKRKEMIRCAAIASQCSCCTDIGFNQNFPKVQVVQTKPQ